MKQTIFDWLCSLIITGDIYLVFIILLILMAICVELLWRFK